jgi:hypothetical protein
LLAGLSVLNLIHLRTVTVVIVARYYRSAARILCLYPHIVVLLTATAAHLPSIATSCHSTVVAVAATTVIAALIAPIIALPASIAAAAAAIVVVVAAVTVAIVVIAATGVVIAAATYAIALIRIASVAVAVASRSPILVILSARLITVRPSAGAAVVNAVIPSGIVKIPFVAYTIVPSRKVSVRIAGCIIGQTHKIQ